MSQGRFRMSSVIVRKLEGAIEKEFAIDYHSNYGNELVQQAKKSDSEKSSQESLPLAASKLTKEELAKKIERLSTALFEVQKENNKVKNDNYNLQQQYAQLVENNRLFLAQSSSQLSMIQDLQSDKQDTKKVYEALQIEIKKLTEENGVLKEKLKKNEQLQTEKENALKEKQQIENDYQKIKLENQSLIEGNQQKDELTKENKDLKDKVKALELVLAQGNVVDLQNRIKQFEQEKIQRLAQLKDWYLEFRKNYNINCAINIPLNDRDGNLEERLTVFMLGINYTFADSIEQLKPFEKSFKKIADLLVEAGYLEQRGNYETPENQEAVKKALSILLNEKDQILEQYGQICDLFQLDKDTDVENVIKVVKEYKRNLENEKNALEKENVQLNKKIAGLQKGPKKVLAPDRCLRILYSFRCLFTLGYLGFE